MGYPYCIGICKLCLIVLLILTNLLKIDSIGSGGVMFGYKGKTYGFTTKTCEGGIFFKNPIVLSYICPNGYFLKRSRGCSAEEEEIVGAEHYVCTEYTEDSQMVQALIPITNADYPMHHTVTLYDDEDMLTGYRRYTVESAARKKYIPKENGSSYVLVTNPHNTPDTSIGKLCYSGIPQAEGSAYKVEVQSDFSDGESYGFFSKGCKESSIKVQPESGRRFELTDGIPDSNRFARAIAAKVIQLDDDADVRIETRRVRKNNPVSDERVFLELNNGEKNETGTSGKDAEGSENEDEGTTTTEDLLTTTEDLLTTTEDLLTTTEYQTTTEMPEIPGIPLLDTELKPDVIIDPDKVDVSIYFLELLQMVIMYVEELSGEVDEDGELIDRTEPSFLDRNSMNEAISDTIWFKILSASVQVVKKIAPSTFPGEIESEFLRAFGYMFRELQDDHDIINKLDDHTLQFILDSLDKCVSTEPSRRPPKYTFVKNTCPDELDSITSRGWLWNTATEKYEVKGIKVELNTVTWGRHQEKFVQANLNQFVEMMYATFDIANAYCFVDFKEDFNAQSRMVYYMMQTVFSNENVQKHWYVDPLDASIFLSLVPSYDGYGYDGFHGKRSPTRELDVLRFALKLRSIPSAWINRPKVEFFTNVSVSTESPLLARDNANHYNKGDPEIILSKSFAVSDRDRLPPPRRPRVNKNSLRRSSGLLGTRSSHPGGKIEWLKRKRRDVSDSDLKGIEIWDGLAYCLSMRQEQNSEGQTKQLGLEPSLETLKSEAVC